MDNYKEVWEDIQGYEGYYQVSNLGRVKSLYKGSAILKGSVNNRGYHTVILYKDGKYKHFLKHRLVAQAFIPNPQKLPQVNHKDEDKSNNNVSNLEWCTNAYNNLYHDKAKRVGIKEGKPVAQYTLSGKLVRIWESACEAGRAGYHAGHIRECCHEKVQTHRGYMWWFAFDDETPTTINPHVKKRFTNRTDLSKPVGQYDFNGNLIKIWPSKHEAKRNGFDDASISYHLKNGKPYKGYFWKQM